MVLESLQFWRKKDYQPLGVSGGSKKVRGPTSSARDADSPAPNGDVLEAPFFDAKALIVVSLYDEAAADAKRRVNQRAQTAQPMELTFQLPEGHKRGAPVCVTGPHGALSLAVPADARPGESCRIRLGPSASYKVDVPKDKGAGDLVSFRGVNGEELQVPVPAGVWPGESFEVHQPVIMVQVPERAKGGDVLSFDGPDGRELSAVVPRSLSSGQYFAVEMYMQQPKAPAAPKQAAAAAAGDRGSAEGTTSGRQSDDGAAAE